MTFQDQCREAARQFLQTVVLVDDQASYNAVVADVNQAVSAHKGVEHDAAELDFDISDPDEFASVAGVQEPISAGRRQKEALDAGAITRGFADSGLICSILRPSKLVPIENEVAKVALKSDVIVLDWEMGEGDNGTTAVSIVQRIMEQDREAGDRLRLISIYTGVRDLGTISKRLGEKFTDLKFGRSKLELHNEAGTIKVVVLGKGTKEDHDADQASHCVEEGDLAERIVGEFAHFSGGLLRNATLASMGHLRNNTHRLLARFNSRLDGPLITHFALLAAPEDAEQYVADLIFQEIGAQIPLGSVSRNFAGPQNIHALMDERYKAGGSPMIIIDKKGDKKFEISVERAKALVEKGGPALKEDHRTIAKERLKSAEFDRLAEEKQNDAIDKEVQKVSNDLNTEGLASRLYCLIDGDITEGVRNHEEFSIASGIRKANGSLELFGDDNMPSVKLGTVVHDGDFYYVCLTPVCDSVRRKEPANFLFGRLLEDPKKFNLVLDDGGNRRRLFINRKDAYLKTFELRPTKDGSVRTEKRDGNIYVPVSSVLTGGKGKIGKGDALATPTVRWVAEMKLMQAQRLVGAVTSNLSRIGLDEFEWLRVLADNWSG